MLIKENPKQECCQLLSKITGISNCKCYREIGWRYFPVISTCTLQGFSGTQGNPVIFTVNTFAVYIYNRLEFAKGGYGCLKFYGAG